jgi:hypothetical protein
MRLALAFGAARRAAAAHYAGLRCDSGLKHDTRARMSCSVLKTAFALLLKTAFVFFGQWPAVCVAGPISPNSK